MKNSLKVMGMIMITGLMSVQLWAADYSSKSMEELAGIRGTLGNATVQERNDFREEWQSRLSTLSAEERAKYMGPPANALRNGNGYGKKGGNASGMQNGGNQGQRNGQGKGNGNRNGQARN